jgi:hypothetical protein
MVSTMVLVVVDTFWPNVLAKGHIQQPHNAVLPFPITKQLVHRKYYGLPSFQHIPERVRRIPQVAERIQVAVCKKERCVSLITLKIALLLHRFFLTGAVAARRRENLARKLRDGHTSTMNVFPLQSETWHKEIVIFPMFRFMNQLHRLKDSHRINSGASVDERVVLLAKKNQVGVVIAFLIGHLRFATWALATTGNNVARFT